jgi:hypothetical protein
MRSGKEFIFIGITFLLTGLLSCGQPSKQPSLIINYPAPAPDTTAAIFLPGIVSTEGLDFNAAYSLDGKTFYFARSKNRKYIILETRFDGNKWTAPTPSALFDTLYSNADPFITADGSIYFISNRPKDMADTTDDYDIYRIARRENKWLEPENLKVVNSDSTEYYVSVASNGNIYFASYREGGLDLYMSRKKDDYYGMPFSLGTAINSDFDEHDPLIAPDESFLIFNSSRPGGFGEADLYIARRQDGRWQQPQNMGKKINTATYEYCPNFTPDGKYFFFSSESDVKWISKHVIDEMVR